MKFGRRSKTGLGRLRYFEVISSDKTVACIIQRFQELAAQDPLIMEIFTTEGHIKVGISGMYAFTKNLLKCRETTRW
jgi:hypothetical protein